MNKPTLVLLSLILLVSLDAQSQNQKRIDSLINLSYTASIDTNLIDTYEKIAKLYLKIQLDSAKVYAQKMINVSEELDYDKGLAMGNNWLGEACLWQGQPNLAVNYFKKTNEIFGKSGKSTMWAHSLQVIANAYTLSAKSDSALLLYNEALEYYQENNDDYSVAKALVNIGKIYSQMGVFTTALNNYYKARLVFKLMDNEYWYISTERAIGVLYGRQQEYDSAFVIYNRLIKYQLEKNNYFALGESYTNLGVLYEGLEDFDKALEAQRTSIKYRKLVNDKRGMAITEMNIGSIFINAEVFDSVMFYLNNSRKTLEEMKSMHALAFNLILTGNYYLKTNQLEKAEQSYLEAYEISENKNLQDNSRQATQALSIVYEEMHDYKNALKYAKIYKIQYDSIINEENIKEQAISKETYKHKLQIVTKEAEIKDANQQKYYAIITGSSIVLLLLLIIIYRRKLQKTKLLQAEQENEIKLKDAKSVAEKRERKRLANMLHDNIAHVISISQRQINSLINKPLPVETKDKLSHIEDNLLLASRMTKVASYELELSYVLKKNIVEQLQDYIKRIRHSHTPEIKFNHCDKSKFDNSSDKINENIFSVFQEMLGNAIKYAKADTIRITLLYDEGKIALQVIDNGVGFNFDEVRHGLGYKNMKERAEKLNGSFTFESEKGFGTKLKFEV